MLLGLTLGCVVLCVKLLWTDFYFSLGSSLHVHLLNINFGLGCDNPKVYFLFVYGKLVNIP